MDVRFTVTIVVQVEAQSVTTSNPGSMADSEIPAITVQDGYVNDAYEDGLQNSDKVNDKLVYKFDYRLLKPIRELITSPILFFFPPK